MVFLVLFVYMLDYIDGFSYVAPSLPLWDEAYLIMVYDFSDVFLDSICQCFVEYLHINVHEGFGSVIVFFNCVFGWLGYQGICSLIERARP